MSNRRIQQNVQSEGRPCFMQNQFSNPADSRPEDPQDCARFCQPLPGSGESCHNWTQVTRTNQGKSIHKRLALWFKLASIVLSRVTTLKGLFLLKLIQKDVNFSQDIRLACMLTKMQSKTPDQYDSNEM